MIRSITIQNFQSHRQSHLVFDPAVNVLTGSSDSGKTAILRALRWLLFNRPQGDQFRSTWGGTTTVSVTLDDGTTVDRWRHNYENAYRLGTQTHFEAMRGDVPQEVAEALNMSDINIQAQHDAPFLLTATPGEVAQFFNRVAHLDVIDKGLQNVQREIRQLEADIRYKTEDLKQKEEELKGYDYLERMEMEVEALEEIEKRREVKWRKRATLKALLDRIDETKQQLDKTEKVLQYEKQVEDVLVMIAEREELKRKRVRLDTLYEHIREDRTDIKNCEWVLTFEGTTNETLQLIEGRETLKMRRKTLFAALSNVKRVSIQLNNENAAYAKLTAKFEKEMGDTCILCGQTIKK